jgi:hypothetical protein
MVTLRKWNAFLPLHLRLVYYGARFRLVLTQLALGNKGEADQLVAGATLPNLDTAGVDLL